MEKKFTKFLRKTVEYSFYLWIFLLPWQTKVILRPGATNFSEISLYLSQFLLLIILIIFFVYRLWRQATNEPISPLWISLVIFEVGILISFFFAPDQILSFYHYVLFLAGIGLFYAVREGTASIGYEDSGLDKTKAIYYFLAGIFLQAILGIYQFLQQSAPAFKYLGLAAHESDVLGTAVVETASGRWLRSYGGFDHPNIFGGVLVIALLIAGYLLAKRKMIRSRGEAAESLLLFVFYFVSLFALFFSFSRAAWLAFGVGGLLLLIGLIIRKDNWIVGRFVALIFFSVVMVLIVAFPYRDLVAVRADAGSRLEQKSISERISFFQEAEKITRENWLFGVGTGNYTNVSAARAHFAGSPWDYQPVHNAFLLLWAESGLVTLAAFVAFLFILIKKNRREGFSGAILAALVVLMLFDHWLLSLPFGIIFLFFVLALI